VLGAGVEIPRPGWYKDGKIADTGYKGRVVLGDCMRESSCLFSPPPLRGGSAGLLASSPTNAFASATQMRASSMIKRTVTTRLSM
jgi:hypothetical protein